VTAIVQAATAHGTKTVSDAIAVVLHPNNAADAHKLAVDLKTIGSALNTPIANLQSDVQAGRTKLLNDLNNIASNNSSSTALQNDTSTLSTDSQDAITTLTNDGQAIQTDLTVLVNDLG
jgi:gas vesicle protein